MSDAFHDLPALAATTFRGIGPSRIAAMTLVVLGDTGDVAASKAHARLARDRIAAALTTVADTYPAGLTALGHSPTPALADARIKAEQALRELSQRAAKGMAPTDTGFCFDVLEPAVSGFLDKMYQELTEAHEEAVAAERYDALDAVKRVDALGRSIRMIAINASIEAARAGDSGRGFMVIAQEIKSLAGRSEELMHDVYTHIEQT
ncbi:MAG: methyl-accepting chemotaxis protein [Pseudomonadota bacterium]